MRVYTVKVELMTTQEVKVMADDMEEAASLSLIRMQERNPIRPDDMDMTVIDISPRD